MNIHKEKQEKEGERENNEKTEIEKKTVNKLHEEIEEKEPKN